MIRRSRWVAARGPGRPRPRGQAPRRLRRRRRRRTLGGRGRQPRSHRTVGATPEPATRRAAALARQLLAELDAVPAARRPARRRARRPRRDRGAGPRRARRRRRGADLADRVHGGWLGRAAGCLLGKPVEKIPREGIRAIAESTGNWPLRGYFTAVGLDPDVAAAYPWNRRQPHDQPRREHRRHARGRRPQLRPRSPSPSSSATATR